MRAKPADAGEGHCVPLSRRYTPSNAITAATASKSENAVTAAESPMMATVSHTCMACVNGRPERPNKTSSSEHAAHHDVMALWHNNTAAQHGNIAVQEAAAATL